MKKTKIISIIFITLMILFINCVSYAKSAKVTTETLRIREKPSTDSKIVDMANQNDDIEVIGEEGSWYKVSYNGKEGYASKEYIDVKESVTSNTTDNTNTQENNMGDTENTSSEENTIEPESEETQELIKDVEEESTTNEKIEGQLGNKINSKTYGFLIPNLSSTKLIEIEKDKQVEIIETISNWSKVKVENKEVWIANEFLYEVITEESTEIPEETEPEEELPAEDEEKETTINQEGYISANASVNLREGPSTNTKSIDQIEKNTAVTVISEIDEWYKISYNGKEGYVSKSLITLGKAPQPTSSRSAEESRNDLNAMSKGTSIVETASLYLGGKYKSGGSSPTTGFDCSGFTQYIYSIHGITIPRSATAQYNGGTKVNKSDMQIGDLVFFSDNAGGKSISHVGIYIGNGQFIHAANSKRGIVTNSLDTNDNYGYNEKFIGAVRY